MQFTDYLELFFANQDSKRIIFEIIVIIVSFREVTSTFAYLGFLSGAVNMTEPEVQDKMASLASSKLTITKDQYVLFAIHTSFMFCVYNMLSRCTLLCNMQ